MANAHSDGNDAIFGDLGNDWIVGGTGKDKVFGGWGDDLMNMDDDQTTAAGENTTPDTHTSYEDRAFGGAGMDVLIGNTGGDRLIDWAGEFNSYLVPFAPFGLGTVSRQLAPALAEFLYALSKSHGADQTRAPNPTRNGEPDGELGLIRQQDFAWQDQTGGPIDPQPGNVPGGSRDVLRSANFNQTSNLEGFAVDSGTWEVDGQRAAGRRQLAPRRRGRRLQHPRLPARVLRGAGVDQRDQAARRVERPTPTSSSTTRVRRTSSSPASTSRSTSSSWASATRPGGTWTADAVPGEAGRVLQHAARPSTG